MGKPTGFMDYGRKAAAYRPVKARIKDYKDVTVSLSEEEVRQQASRCMDCGVPFCHSTGCPCHNLIPEWNDLVYKGHWKEALRKLEKTNTLPEITSRVCPPLCEAACTLSINDSPVTIQQIERAITEYGFAQGWVRPALPRKEIDKSIAIIGSGPAGLSAAQSLRKTGYAVTVFERSDKIGGILRYGIPDFKLEKWVLDRRLKLMEESGITFETGVNIGEDISYRYLEKDYDAILLTTGAGQPRELPIPGRELHGIYFAMDYLTQSNRSVDGDSKKTDSISAKGKNVLVIGGGDTGSDCIGTANRQRARKIYQFEILPRPEEWKETWNPTWPDWPLILRTTSSHEEGTEREWSILTKRFGGHNNTVEEVHCSRIEWKAPEGNQRPQMVEVAGSEFSLKVDLVLLAMGFVYTEHNTLLKDMRIEFDEQGNIKTHTDYFTTVEGVFAAGDSAIGASLVVRAVYHGQEAAQAIHDFLMKR